MYGEGVDRALAAARASGSEPKKVGKEWRVRCPAHADERPSLDVSQGYSGAVLRCRSGECSADKICYAWKINVSDLFDEKKVVSNGSAERTVVKEASWDIFDTHGEHVVTHVRFDFSDGKKEYPWKRDGSFGLKGLRCEDIPLYLIHTIQARPTEPVVVVEGEKCADALTERGILAVGTVTGGGEKRPSDRVLDDLRDRDVILWPDNDASGFCHMRLVMDALEGVAKSIRLVLWSKAPKKGDAADFDGTDQDLRDLLSNAIGDGSKKRLLDEAAASAKKPAKSVVVTSAGVDETAETHDEQATDVGNGQRLVRLYGQDIRWCKPLGWLAFDGEKWVRNEHRVIIFAKESAKLMRVEAETLDGDERKAARKHALGSEKSDRIRAAISMAQSEPGVAVEHDALDSNPWLLAVTNGVIDLTTGKLQPHSRKDLITRAARVSFDPAATCPRWMKFLTETFSGDQDLIEFIQKAFGYSLTASNREQCLFLCHGVGSNGKSTLLGVFRGILGDHATNADFSTFLLSNKSQSPGPRGDLARLAGVRFVSSTEPEGSARFSEGTVKSITGGDPITCAFKFQDEFAFTPKFKLWLGANHKPRIKGTDHAIWRRIRLIPFLNIVTGDKIDHTLNETLAFEYPGILNWGIAGGIKWQEEGLTPPEAVLGATQAYRDEQDTLSEFIKTYCNVIPGGFVSASEIHAAYLEWVEVSGDEPVSKRLLGTMLCERGYERDRDSSARGFTGIQLKNTPKIPK